MAEKLPYVPFYPKDFSADPKVEAMTTEEVGAYMLLLCKAWYEEPAGSIPTDDTVLARWARLDSDGWARCRLSVLSCFVLGQDGRYHQKRMRDEYNKMRTVRKAKSEGGKRSAVSRRRKRAPEDSYQESSKSLRRVLPRVFEDSYQESSKPLENKGKMEVSGEAGGENGRAYVCVSSNSSSHTQTGKGGAGGKPEPAGFSRFWEAYPRKVARLDAEQVWYELAPDGPLIEAMLAAIERQKRSDQWQRGVYLNPGNWLRQRRWEDQLTGGHTPPPEKTDEQRLAETLRRRQEFERRKQLAEGGGT